MSSKGKTKIVPTRKKIVLPLKVKIEILDRLRLGESFASISRSFKVNESTIRFIKKSEDKIRNSLASTSLAVKIVRNPEIEKMEAALSLWIEDRNQKRVPINGLMIREKAKRLYEHFSDTVGERITGRFQASTGWFRKFKMRLSINNIQLVEKKLALDYNAAQRCREEFLNLIAEGDYKPEQVFNADETVLFWKQMPDKTSVSKNVNPASGFEIEEDNVTVLLCSNASGGCIIKPLMLCRSLSYCALENQNNDNVPVFLRANNKSWVTRNDFCDWFQNCFVPEVKTYLKLNNLDFKAVLVLDTAPGHPRELETMLPNIKVIFLPPSTTGLLQPIDQGIKQVFKLYYIRRTFKFILDTMVYDPRNIDLQRWKNFDVSKCIVYIKDSLQELNPYILKSSWKNLWPTLTDENDDISVINETLTEIVVHTAHQIGRGGFEQIQLSDVQKLLECKDDDLTETDLEEMLIQQTSKEKPSKSTGKLTFNLKNLSEGLRMANELCDFFMKIDPSAQRSLIFKKKIVNATAAYQTELKGFLKSEK